MLLSQQCPAEGLECAGTQNTAMGHPGTAEPAAPIAATVCVKAECSPAPFSGITPSSVVVGLAAAFPVEGAEGQD